MKIGIFLSMLLCSTFLSSQVQVYSYGFVDHSYSMSMGDYVVGENKKTTEGSPYLYETWDNESKVYFENKAYIFKACNYNAHVGQFEAKVSKDSVFVINPSGVDKVVLRNRVFKQYLDPVNEKKAYFEEIMKSKDLLLLRKFITKIKKAEVNPLTKTPMGLPVLKLEEDFYVLKGESTLLEKITFKKSAVLDLVDKNFTKEVQSYVKENGLKYNNLEDVTTILAYYNTLGS
ncbi:hypothetical protein [Maribacter arenosus]|uniref:Uncharacterized protein n=1 Tax=Maribacter arenosus TaxID=1854708 RepID=A0ABR7VAM4_9FLAO|nr:hypothetical protein [Maribacter arenosus]MBD0850706.1 hypothetical protein [Maribacter arenosus]